MLLMVIGRLSMVPSDPGPTANAGAAKARAAAETSELSFMEIPCAEKVTVD
jgi:hypothetical protein